MKPIYSLFFLLSFFILSSAFSIATIRYVSKTGNSTPPYTSWQTAADSIQKCVNISVDGDTIYVANGVYKENLIINTAISLIGSSMDSTVIDGTGLTVITVELSPNGIGGTIENFKILGKGFNQGACILSEKDIEIRNCKLENGIVGVRISNAASVVENIIVKNCTQGYYGGCESIECYNFLNNCLMLIETQNSNGITLTSGINYLTNNIVLFSTSNSNAGNGVYISLAPRVHIYNNLISGFSDNIFVELSLDSCVIENNVLINHKSGGGTASINCINDDATIVANILKDNKRAVSGNWQLDINYNLLWQNITNYYSINIGDSDIVANPMFVKDTIPTANGSYDFHLQKYSPAIDKGDPSILDVDGSRSDMGMFGGPYGESYTYQDLAPKPPVNLTASLDSGLVHLKWNKNTEADLFRYRVYRDTVPDFVYDTTKIIAVLSDTSFYDDPPQKYISGNYYYKITAIDSAYHQSPASEEVHINITGIPEAPPIVVEHYNLLQNYPNPFTPGTTILYRLKAPGYVKVMVYNLLGEQVKVLVNKYQSAGYYEVSFHPTATERQSAEGKIEFETGYGDIVSGIYLYRIEVIGEGNIPIFTDMRKMMLVK